MRETIAGRVRSMKYLERFSGSAIPLTILFLSLAAAHAPAQKIDAIDPALRAGIDRIATQVLEQTGVPSASVAVVKGGKLVYTHAYGSARLAAGATPAVPDRKSTRLNS